MECNTDEENVPEKPKQAEFKQEFDTHIVTCEVCFEIMYQPLNCSPCNHKFCASCIYRWMDTHFTCPKCRVLLKEVTKDGSMEQLTKWYLKCHPDRYRHIDTIDELDKIELEFLEKLVIRGKGPYLRGFPFNDKETDLLETGELLDLLGQYANLPATPQLGGGGILQRRLLLHCARKYRDQEWESRIRYLREKFHIPAPMPPPPPPAPSAPPADASGNSSRNSSATTSALARYQNSAVAAAHAQLQGMITRTRNANETQQPGPSNTQPVLPVSLPNNMTQEDFTAQQRNALINAISGRLLGQQVPAPEQAVPDTENPRRRRNPRDPEPRDPYPLRRRRTDE